MLLKQLLRMAFISMATGICVSAGVAFAAAVATISSTQETPVVVSHVSHVNSPNTGVVWDYRHRCFFRRDHDRDWHRYCPKPPQTSSSTSTSTSSTPTTTSSTTTPTSSSSSTTTSTTTTSSTTTGTVNGVVPANPSGPGIPAGGWNVVYADHFVNCLWQPSTSCSLGTSRSDQGWSAQTDGAGNGNPTEIAAFEAGNIDVTNQGLIASCYKTPNLGKLYTCGQVLANGGSAGKNTSAPAAPKPFQFNLNNSDTFVIQYEAQLPVNQGNMDPGIWENSPGNANEVDNAEYFGMHQPPSGSNTWCGDGWAFPNIPFGGGITGNGDNSFWCQSGGPNFDPSAGLHTYTIEFSSGNYVGYADGVKYTSGTYSLTSSTAYFKLILGMGMRSDAKTGQSYPIGSAGLKLIIPYVEVFAPTAQGTTHTLNSGLAPGTSVG